LSGIALVMLCTVVGSATDVGGVAVVCGMYLALGVVVTGCSYALTTPELPHESTRATTTSLLAPDDGWSSGRVVGSPTAAPDSREVGTRVVPDVGAMPEGNEKSAVADLTGREEQVLALLAEGFSNAGIAANMCISERTVDAHLRSVFTKLDLPDTRLDNRRVHAARVWRVSEGSPLSRNGCSRRCEAHRPAGNLGFPATPRTALSWLSQRAPPTPGHGPVLPHPWLVVRAGDGGVGGFRHVICVAAGHLIHGAAQEPVAGVGVVATASSRR
jgi:DNA-binding CsgD family transcriptional regulator